MEWYTIIEQRKLHKISKITKENIQMRPNEKDKRNMIYSQLFNYNKSYRDPVNAMDITESNIQEFDVVKYNRDEILEAIGKLGDMVYRLALIQGGNTETADLIYQKTFLKFVRRKEYIPAGETRKRWLIREVTSGNIKRRGYPGTSVITECVYKLSKQKRIVFHLHFYENYSQSEIAEILKISERDVICYIDSIIKEMPNIFEAERVWESENYITRYQEEMQMVKHNSMLDEKIKDKANKPLPKINGKTILCYFFVLVVIEFCLWGAWDTLINTYHFDKSFTYLVSSIQKVEVDLSETEMIEFTPEQYQKTFDKTMDSLKEMTYISTEYDTYKAFYQATGIEIFGADVLEWKEFCFSLQTSQRPLCLDNITFQIYNYGRIIGWFTYLDEDYYFDIYFKVKDFTSPDEVLEVHQKQVNYSHEYAENKFAAFICSGTKSAPISQDIYFVEDGMLYVLSQVDATMEETEKVKDLLDLMAGSE